MDATSSLTASNVKATAGDGFPVGLVLTSLVGSFYEHSYFQRKATGARRQLSRNYLPSTIKYVAATKPAFFLSEIIPYLDEPLPVHQLFSIISPELSAMGLMAKKGKGDFEISRIPPAQPYLMNQEERERQQHFFTKREMPGSLAQSIENYITKKVGPGICGSGTPVGCSPRPALS